MPRAYLTYRNIRRSQISLTRSKISWCALNRGEISFSPAAVLFADKFTRGYAGMSTSSPRKGGPAVALISLSFPKIFFFSCVLEIKWRFPFLLLKSRMEIVCSFRKMDVRWKHPWTSIVCRPTDCGSLWKLFSGIYFSCPTCASREFCFITRNGKKLIVDYNTMRA